MKIFSFKLHKKTLILSVFCLLLFAAIIFLCCKANGILSVSADDLKGINSYKKTILIDPGHGGEDGGTASASGILEKDINLNISLYLRDILKLSGFEVKMTRETDTDLGDKSLGTVRERKVSDLKNRVKLINQSPDIMLLSIHQNYFEQSKYSGTQVFYSSNNQASINIAESIRLSITGLTQPENTRELKDATTVYILKNSSCPAVIVECGFLSNPEEADKLNTAEYQKQIAYSIACGLIDYYK